MERVPGAAGRPGDAPGVVEIGVRRLDGASPPSDGPRLPELALPEPARPGDAGADLRAAHDVVIPPRGGRAVVGTGLAMAIPEGCCGLVLPRSGLARRHGVSCLNSPGLIDAGYRGEVAVLLINTDPTEPFTVNRGDRIAQLVVVPFLAARFVPGDLSASARGEGGWGQSGRQ
jgi:dUTP pyrophosphatase